jgi:hypothetical protein
VGWALWRRCSPHLRHFANPWILKNVASEILTMPRAARPIFELASTDLRRRWALGGSAIPAFQAQARCRRGSAVWTPVSASRA